MPTHRVPPGSTGLVGRRHETRMLRRLIGDLGAGRGGALLLLGEAGIGKTALIESVRTPPRTTVLRARGTEPARRRAYDGLRRLCAPLSAVAAGLPAPQHRALQHVLHPPGTPGGPDPFLTATATLNLLVAASAERPVLCVVDDAHGLDRASARVLAFVARRVQGAQVALLVAARHPHDRTELAGLPPLLLTGLPERDARRFLSTRVSAPFDPSVTDRVIAEAGGNPLALLELSRTAGLPAPGAPCAAAPPGTPGEADLRSRIAALPAATRQLLLVAAAEPTGHPLHLWRALRHLGIDTAAAAPAEEAALLRIDLWIRFGDPRVRSLVWYGATPAERRTAHRALAVAAEAAREPDRWIWHHAHSLPGPDEAVAGALERAASPDRAPGRSAAFLEAAAHLTPDARDRTARTLRAAATHRTAGAHDAAERLLVRACSGPLDRRLTAEAATLRARMALDLGRFDTAAGLLRQAAALMSPLDASSAREIHLDGLVAAACAGRLASGPRPPEPPDPADFPRPAPPPGSPRPVDVLLDALTDREHRGLALAAPALRSALRGYLDRQDSHPLGPGEAWAVCSAAIDLWDENAWRRLADRHVRDARRAGTPAALPAALGRRALLHVHAGEFEAAAALVREIDALPGGTGGWGAPCPRIVLAAWRGDRARTTRLVSQTRRDALARGDGQLLTAVGYARTVLFNGLGRPADTVRTWRSALHLDETGLHTWGLVELVEAAVRSGESDLADAALDGVLRRTEALSTPWALGVRLRCRALLSGRAEAGDLHQEAIRRLDLGDAVLPTARSRLLYGEWLRAGGYDIEARRQLQQAYAVFSHCGSTAFAARTARELRAAGEPTRALRTGRIEPSSLTARERRIAGLVAAGATTREVGIELRVSPRTVDAHLRNVFKKTGISSRRQLRDMMPLGIDGESPEDGRIPEGRGAIVLP
ncbi:AAA family ATPase [Streptomyces yaizuensis]|uniref:LuxR family transcriptional regulator n=1 Tax=Streptomyces yaizuensis TaxID=2989713 RepID=A0ABQ5NYA8_9ACTN|nr:AAA family ATPase [Streptomyces sp. YSPA8]GLF95359.1 LuxR family transcriptional regulator [Streptomyces sp. YSPA8]